MAKRRRSSRLVTTVQPRRRGRQSVSEPRRLPWVRVLLGSLAIVGAIGFVGLAFLSTATARSYSCDELLQATAGSATPDGIKTESLGARHVTLGTKIRYGFCPPTSGQHYNAAGVGPLRPGFYGPDADAGPGGWVHNLEHGYVVSLYRCTDGTCPSEADLAALRGFAANGPPSQSAAACGYRSKVVVARFDDMTTPFALLAWDRPLLLDRFDESIAQQFASRSIEATAPEPNAC